MCAVSKVELDMCTKGEGTLTMQMDLFPVAQPVLKLAHHVTITHQLTGVLGLVKVDP